MGHKIDFPEKLDTHKRKLIEIAKRHAENLHYTSECPVCHALMPTHAAFCFCCGEALSQLHVSLVNKITRKMWKVAIICTMTAVLILGMELILVEHAQVMYLSDAMQASTHTKSPSAP